MVWNGADASDHFYLAGKKLPFPGHQVDPDEMLAVFADLYVDKMKRLTGTLEGRRLIARVAMVDLEAGTLFLSDSEKWTPLGNFRISQQPRPVVQEPHGDVKYYLDPVERVRITENKENSI